MSNRLAIQDSTGIQGEIAGYGGTRAWATGNPPVAGVPVNGYAGYAPGCIYQDVINGALYVNIGSNLSSLWTKVVLASGGAAWSGLIPANAGPTAFAINDGTTNILNIDSRNTVTGVTAVFVKASPPTIATAAGDAFHQMGIAANTITLTGTTTVTALDGLGLNIGVPTVTDASSATVTTLSNLYVALPVVGGSATGTNIYSAHFAGAIKVDGNLSFVSQAATINVDPATAASFVVSDGVVSMLSLDTRTTATGGGGVTITGEAVTLASAGSAMTAPTLSLAAKTNTLTGTTTTTSWLGSALYVNAQTWTDAGAATLTTASAIHITANAAAGGSLTITNSYMISTSVAGCFLTNAGTWTSVSTEAHKEEIKDAKAQDVFGVLDAVKARRFKWKEDFVNDFGRDRFGLIAEELPPELLAPGCNAADGLPDGTVAAFAVAVCKILREENQQLTRRMEKLEALLSCR